MVHQYSTVHHFVQWCLSLCLANLHVWYFWIVQKKNCFKLWHFEHLVKSLAVWLFSFPGFNICCTVILRGSDGDVSPRLFMGPPNLPELLCISSACRNARRSDQKLCQVIISILSVETSCDVAHCQSYVLCYLKPKNYITDRRLCTGIPWQRSKQPWLVRKNMTISAGCLAEDSGETYNRMGLLCLLV